jgi:hypothetical protein
MATPDTFSRLLKTKEEKIANLSEKTFADNNLDYKSNTDMGDGYVENNNNKIWGISEDWTPQENSFARDYAEATFSLPNSSKKDRRLYSYGVKDEGEYIDPLQDFQPVDYAPRKDGLSTGKSESSDVRYIKFPSGTRGVDITKNKQDLNLDYTAATAIEALNHSSKVSLDNRLVRERTDGWFDYVSPTGMKVINKAERDALLGSGSSEYYTNHASRFDDNYDPAKVDQAKVIAGINKAMEIVRGNSTYTPRPDINDFKTPTSSFGNTLAGFASSIVGEALVGPADALGDFTGLYDIGNEEHNDKMVQGWFGYDPEVAAQAMEKVGVQWDILADENVPTADRVRAAGNGIIEVFTTPEMLSTSLGTVLAWASPGKFLKMLDVGTNYDKAARLIDTAVKAGTTTKQAGRAQKIKKFMSIDGAKSFVTSQAGMITSSVANVNYDYQQFVINNNGVELEGSDKAEFFAGRFVLKMLNQNLDKFTDFSVIKSTGIIKSIIPAIKQMTNKEFSALAKTMGKGVVKTTENMGKEAAQEYSQTMMDLFSTRFGSAQFKDADEFIAFITDERNTRESGIAALAGAGGSLQFEVAGIAVPAAVGAANIAGSIITPTSAPDRGDIPDNATEVEVAQAIQENLEKFKAATTLTEQYYAAQGSGDAKAQATAKAAVADAETKLMNGSSAIFHSDEDFSVKLAKLTSIVEVISAENPNISDTKLKILAARRLEATKEQLPEIAEAIDKGIRDGLEFARIKPMFEVSEEVRNSPKGFVTYYAKAKAALAQGDTEAYTTNIRKLDTFYTHQTNKLANLNTGIDNIRGNIEAEAEALLKNDDNVNSRKDALIHLKRKYQEDGKNKLLDVPHSDAPTSASTKVGYKDVVRKMLDPAYSDGIFKITSEITSATTKMEEVYKSLIAKESGEVEVDDVATTPEAEELVASPTPDVTATVTEEDVNVPEYEESSAVENGSDTNTENEYYNAPVEADTTQEPVAEEATVAEPVQESAYTLKVGANKGTPIYDKTSKRLIHERKLLELRISRREKAGKGKHKDHDDIVADIDAITQYLDAETDKVPPVIEITEPAETIDIPPAPTSVEEDLSIPPAPEDDTEGLSIPEEQDFDVNEMPPADTNTSEEDDYLMSNEDDLSMPPSDEQAPFDENDDGIIEDNNEDDIINNEEDMYSEYEESNGVPRDKRVKKDSLISPFITNKQALKANKKAITERRAELRKLGIIGKDQLTDPDLQALFEQKEQIKLESESFVSLVVGTIASRFGAGKIPDRFKTNPFDLYRHYKGGNSKEGKTYQTTLDKLFGSLLPTGFTMLPRTMGDIQKSTKAFADKLTENVEFDKSHKTQHNQAVANPASFLLYTSEGKFNTNVLEAMHAAATEFLVREASNLLGDARTIEDVAEMFNISEDEVTPSLYQELAGGGIHLKFAADAIGALAYKNLGLDIKSTQEKEAMVTYLGLTALQGISGDFIIQTELSQEAASTLKGDKVVMIKGTHDIPGTNGEPDKLGLFSSLKAIVATNLDFEEELGVEIDKERTYRDRPTVGNRKVKTHRSEYQNSPVDQQEAVNRMEKTPFKFNNGSDVLLEVFSDSDGALDVKALVDHVLGPDSKATNLDTALVLKARKASLTRSVTHYKEAKEERGTRNLFFDWFVAKNHRLHLDSNRINPQSDKILARWLLTTENSRFDISKKDINDVLKGKNPVTMEAVMFAYSIVQAFDGNKGIPDVSKNNENEIVEYAAKLLKDTTESELVTMMKASQHVGHAALAIANIRKYKDKSRKFTSDMVLEVDGLTNGFAFRIMQFPLATGSIPATAWLEKIGFITEDNEELFNMESMNEAKDNGMKDVYITVGGVLGGNIIKNKSSMRPIGRKWVELFKDHDKLPDFSSGLPADKQEIFDKFVRNLVKSAVMIFNYAAGADKIASGMVNDQIMGQGYMKGKGLLDLLTETDEKGNYVVSKDELETEFPKDGLGTRYHNARVKLKNKSIFDIDDADIKLLKQDLFGAIGNLYSAPIEETLEGLFGRQTEINTAIISASTFMYQHFEETYKVWRDTNPEATEEDKIEYLRDMASIVPGVKSANSDDQLTKITFLKGVLEQTNNDVVIKVAGGRTVGTNTVSRGFGDPGVGPAVLTVLSLDSSVLSRAINEFYKKEPAKSALTVHDAEILGIGEHGAINKYNKQFYFTNRSYSISQEYVNAMNNFEAMVGTSIAEAMTITNNKGELISYGTVMANLVVLNNEIQVARSGIFGKIAKVGQMVGIRDTMAYIDPGKLKEEAEEGMRNLASRILEEFGSAQLKAALGKDHAANLKKLKSMLEGCV